MAFTIDLDDEELPQSLESTQSDERSLESPQRKSETPQRSLLEEAEAVVAMLRPTSSPSQASDHDAMDSIVMEIMMIAMIYNDLDSSDADYDSCE